MLRLGRWDLAEYAFNTRLKVQRMFRGVYIPLWPTEMSYEGFQRVKAMWPKAHLLPSCL